MEAIKPEQRGRIGRLWKEKRRLQPKMKNAGMSFVRILEYVARGEKLPDESEDQTIGYTSKHKHSSIEQKTRIHRLATTRRSAFDAFSYVNRIPDKPYDDETRKSSPGAFSAGLANQEGRVLLKVPPGMDRLAYDGFKTFLRYEGAASVGNCAACHSPVRFHVMAKSHIGQQKAERGRARRHHFETLVKRGKLTCKRQ